MGETRTIEELKKRFLLLKLCGFILKLYQKLLDMPLSETSTILKTQRFHTRVFDIEIFAKRSHAVFWDRFRSYRTNTISQLLMSSIVFFLQNHLLQIVQIYVATALIFIRFQTPTQSHRARNFLRLGNAVCVKSLTRTHSTTNTNSIRCIIETPTKKWSSKKGTWSTNETFL